MQCRYCQGDAVVGDSTMQIHTCLCMCKKNEEKQFSYYLRGLGQKLPWYSILKFIGKFVSNRICLNSFAFFRNGEERGRVPEIVANPPKSIYINWLQVVGGGGGTFGCGSSYPNSSIKRVLPASLVSIQFQFSLILI